MVSTARQWRNFYRSLLAATFEKVSTYFKLRDGGGATELELKSKNQTTVPDEIGASTNAPHRSAGQILKTIKINQEGSRWVSAQHARACWS
jgi:hypothetical protein